jgi:hypothetical protein
MSQPVKLSDALVLDARIAAGVQERSIAGQVEFWAKLGQAVEPLLSTRQAVELRRTGKARPLSELLGSVETPEGRARTKAYLEGRPYPHYRQFPGQARVYIRTDADGKETVGRFVNRAFVAIEEGLGFGGPSARAEAGTESEAAVGIHDDANADRTKRLIERTA